MDIIHTQALKHAQQVYQVSVPVTNNVTTFPITIYYVTLQKPFPPKAKNQPLHTVNWNLDWSLMLNQQGGGKNISIKYLKW